jgi:hypothetical protein
MPRELVAQRAPWQASQVACGGSEENRSPPCLCQYERAWLLKMKGPVARLHHRPKGQSLDRQLRMLSHTPWRMDK